MKKQQEIILKNLARKLFSSFVFLIVFLFTFLQEKVFAQEIFSNQITDPNPSSYNPFTSNQYTDVHLSASGIGRGTGITPAIGLDRYNAANFSANLRDTSDYFSFIMAPDSAYQINFTSFVYNGQKNTEGPVSFSLKSSINGYSTTIGFPNATGTTISLTAATFQNVRVPIEFRLYAWGAVNSTGTFSINDFSFNGEVLLSPQLSSTSIASFGNVCVNNLSATNTFSILGYNLTSDSVKLSPVNAYQYSLDNLNFYDSLSIGMVGTQSRLIYVRFLPIAAISYFGNITISGGGASEIFVPVVGRGLGTVPAVSSGTVTNITTSSAVINVTITSSGCSSISSYGIEYSTSPGFANGTGNNVPGTNLSGSFFSVSLTGLTPPGQTFYFHTYAINSGGIKYGVENSFTLLSNVSAITIPTTGSGSLASFGNVCINTTSSANSFRITGSVLDGSNIVIGPLSNFSFSLSSSGTYSNTLTLTQGGSGYSYTSGTLTGCIIYVKFTPTIIGSYNGVIPIFGGGAPAASVNVIASCINSIPVATTGTALAITALSANLQGVISSSGCSTVSSYGFEYSTTPGFTPGTGIRVAASNLNGNAFSLSLSGLSPSTVYYYCAYAINNGGTGYGLINNFLTTAVPTKLIITEVLPNSPFALAPFSITVTAVDNLVAMNPINVTENTAFSISLVTGSYVLNIPNSQSGLIAAGTNSVTITGNFYSHDQNDIGIQASATSGMLLDVSPIYYFDVLPYSGAGDFIWSSNGSNIWLEGDNWQIGLPPGASLQTNNHIAHFTSLARLDTTIIGGCGIDMHAVGQDFHVGAIVFENSYTANHVNGIVTIGNSSTQVNGVLNIDGVAVNNLGGISGNNYDDVLIANYMNGSQTKTLAINNNTGAGIESMELNLSDTGNIIAPLGNEIDINVRITGSQPLTFTGGGTFKLTPSGVSATNLFAGKVIIADGIVIAGNQGAFNSLNPSDFILGSLPSNRGELNCNGKNITIGSLSTNGNAGMLNKIHNGTSNATLTINSSNNTIFSGTIIDGTSGRLSLIKNGVGMIELDESNNYTGSTTINNGVIKLNKFGGNTINENSVVVLNGGELQISSNQTIKNITLNGGILKIDNGVMLTITGNYNVGAFSTTTLINNGTIKINCNSLQSFPGSTVTVSYMNNLIANCTPGIQLDNDLNVEGILELATGTFTVGNHLLTINNPIAGNGILYAGNTSSLKISGIAPNIIIPTNIIQLKNLTVNNTQGTVLQGNLNIATQLLIEAGLVIVGNNITLNGLGNLVMSGGELRLLKNGVTLPELTGTYTLNGGAVVFAGDGIGNNAQTIKAINYYDLVSLSGGGRVLSTSGTIGIGNQFIPADNHYETIGSIIDFFKPGNQDVPAFNYYHLKLSGGFGNVKSLTGNISIYNRLTLLSDTRMALSDFDASLLSDSVMTASVSYITTSNSFLYNGSGRFIVFRYIPVGVTHPKSWQFLAVPDFGGTLKSCWQEGNNVLENSSPNFGTTISGGMSGAVSRGFDFYSPAGSSIKYYNSNSNNWIGIDDGVMNTETYPIANSNGYMVFVRGDRSVQSYNASAVPTTLRTRGKLYSRGTDAPVSINVPVNQLQSVGNPYASAINFTSLLSTSTSIDSKFYVWDPLLPGSYGFGGFQTISSLNAYRPIPGGTINYNANTSYTSIQSGQAFFVYSTPGGVVNFSESNKITGSAFPFRQLNTAISPLIRTELFNTNNNLTDGNVVLFSDEFSDTFDANDAIKINNFSELLAVSNHEKKLALDTRKPVLVNDTIFYKINQLKQQQYHLHFSSEQFDMYNREIFLKDNYLHLDTPIDLNGTDYYFTVSNDSASFAEDRFYLFFKTISVLPISEFKLNGVSHENYVSLNLHVINEMNVEKYKLQKSNDGIHFSTIEYFSNVTNNGSNVTYPFFDFIQDELVFYRIEILTTNGMSSWSNTIKFVGKKEGPTIRINPNPITSNQIHLMISGVTEGKYTACIYNLNGQKLASFAVDIKQGMTSKVLKINSSMPKGYYYLDFLDMKLFFSKE